MYVSVLLLFIAVSHVIGAPSDVTKVAIGAGGVSASWGGYSASAGLGGEVGNGKRGGLFAAAESPHGRAAAGLGGAIEKTAQGGLNAGAEYPQNNVATADVGGYVDASSKDGNDVAAPQNNFAATEVGGAIGVSKGGYDATADTSSAGSSESTGGGAFVTTGVHTTKVIHTQPGFFDRIFNIPISVLKSVNTYLNNKDHTKSVYVHGEAGVSSGHVPHEVTGGAQDAGSEVPLVAPAPGSTGISDSAYGYGEVQSAGVTSYETKPDLRSSVAGSGSAEGAVLVRKPRPNYDQIFNIPISALKSVNQLLNG